LKSGILTESTRCLVQEERHFREVCLNRINPFFSKYFIGDGLHHLDVKLMSLQRTHFPHAMDFHKYVTITSLIGSEKKIISLDEIEKS